MSLLDTASLIVTPNGYKEGTLYSVIPSDGSGDMSVVRATTATRVNSAGLVELVPYNILGYSEMFDNAYWNKGNSSVTADVTTAPNGTLTADKIIESTSNSGHFIEREIFTSSGQAYTISIFLKKAERNFGCVGAYTNESKIVFINLTTGAVTNTTGTILSSNVENVGNGWFRVSLTFTSTSSVYAFSAPSDNGTNFSYTGDGTSGIYQWGAQLVEGSNAKDYQRTETRLNIPRLDYSNGTCPSLLVEPQRTNLALYSSSFDNGTWSKNELNVTTNGFISPSGIQDADKIIPNTVNTFHTVQQVLSVSSGSNYTFSTYAKASGYNYVVFNTGGSTGGNSGPIVNLSNGTIAGYFGITDYNAVVEDAGNGWYKISFTFTTNSTSANVDINIFPTSTVASYSGDGTSGCIFWGYQFELGAYPTSYIPTTSASVTRNADVVSKTGISSLIGQTEGTVFVDYIPKSNYSLSEQNLLTLYNDSAPDNNNIQLYIASGSPITVYIVASSSLQTNINTGISPLTPHKIAIAYKQNDIVVYIDGNQVGTDTSANIPALNSIVLNNYAYGNYMSASGIKASALWKTRLTNTQLQTLTSL